MKTIYKFPIDDCQGKVLVTLHRNAEVISAINQYEDIVIYAIVDPNEELVEHEFLVLGTGWEVPDNINFDDYDFINTVSLVGGGLIFHIFIKI